MNIVDKLKDSLDYEFNLTYSEHKQLLDYITTLQEKVEQLEKENEATLKNYGNLVKEWKQLENIRKEAIDYMKKFIFEPLLINEDRKLIMFNENLKNFENILNKGE